MVQFRLEAPVVALPQDRFVIRGSSVVQTLAGGIVLNNHPSRHKRFNPTIIEELTLLRDGSPHEVVTYHVRQSSYGGLSFSELWGRIGNVSPDQVRKTLDRLIQDNEIIAVGTEGVRYIHRNLYETLKEEIGRCLEDFHTKSPMALGLSKEELKTKLPKAVKPRLFQLLLQEMIQTNQVILEKEKIRFSGHRISVQEDLLDRLVGTIREGQLTPPSVKELVDRFSMDQQDLKNHLELLVNRGVLIRLKGDLYFHREPILQVKEALVDFIRANKELTPSQFKDLTKVSRKFAIPLLEYFDNAKVTLRVGDKRILRGNSG